MLTVCELLQDDADSAMCRASMSSRASTKRAEMGLADSDHPRHALRENIGNWTMRHGGLRARIRTSASCQPPPDCKTGPPQNPTPSTSRRARSSLVPRQKKPPRHPRCRYRGWQGVRRSGCFLKRLAQTLKPRGVTPAAGRVRERRIVAKPIGALRRCVRLHWPLAGRPEMDPKTERCRDGARSNSNARPRLL